MRSRAPECGSTTNSQSAEVDHTDTYKKIGQVYFGVFTKLGYECVETKGVKIKEGKGGAYTIFISKSSKKMKLRG